MIAATGESAAARFRNGTSVGVIDRAELYFAASELLGFRVRESGIGSAGRRNVKRTSRRHVQWL
jgi:hypothetical protein